MTSSTRPTGLFGFTLVWLGQLVSLLATGMTQFALTIWVFEKTGSATALGLMQVFFITPFLIISPLAGALVDRHDRKLMMMVSDLGAGLATVIILILQAFGRLEVWHLYATAIIAGLGNAFQWPAYSAAITTMVPKAQYGRANGLMSLLDAGPAVFAPLLAGALLPFIGLTGIMTIDVVTFLLAIGVLLLVHVPPPARTEAGRQALGGGLLREAAYGFRYIFQRPSLLGLQLVFFGGNLAGGITFTVLAPMILTRTGNDETALGFVQSAGAVGGVIGGLVMSAWGGTKRRVHGVLLGHILVGLCGNILLGLGRGVPGWAVPMFLGMAAIPWINGSNQAIWQAKVAPDVQGRVFAARRLIAWLTNPIAPLIGGTLADFVLEPAMRSGGGLADAFGWLVGAGPGSGMALLITLCGLLTAAVGLAGYLTPAVRNAEDLLPDHDHAPAAAAAPLVAEAAGEQGAAAD
jgi:MFS family permease